MLAAEPGPRRARTASPRSSRTRPSREHDRRAREPGASARWRVVLVQPAQPHRRVERHRHRAGQQRAEERVHEVRRRWAAPCATRSPGRTPSVAQRAGDHAPRARDGPRPTAAAVSRSCGVHEGEPAAPRRPPLQHLVQGGVPGPRQRERPFSRAGLIRAASVRAATRRARSATVCTPRGVLLAQLHPEAVLQPHREHREPQAVELQVRRAGRPRARSGRSSSSSVRAMRRMASSDLATQCATVSSGTKRGRPAKACCHDSRRARAPRRGCAPGAARRCRAMKTSAVSHAPCTSGTQQSSSTTAR